MQTVVCFIGRIMCVSWCVFYVLRSVRWASCCTEATVNEAAELRDQQEEQDVSSRAQHKDLSNVCFKLHFYTRLGTVDPPRNSIIDWVVVLSSHTSFEISLIRVPHRTDLFSGLLEKFRDLQPSCVRTLFNLGVSAPTGWLEFKLRGGVFNSSPGTAHRFKGTQTGTYLSWFTLNAAAERRECKAAWCVKSKGRKTENITFLLHLLKGFILPPRKNRSSILQ